MKRPLHLRRMQHFWRGRESESARLLQLRSRVSNGSSKVVLGHQTIAKHRKRSDSRNGWQQMKASDVRVRWRGAMAGGRLEQCNLARSDKVTQASRATSMAKGAGPLCDSGWLDAKAGKERTSARVDRDGQCLFAMTGGYGQMIGRTLRETGTGKGLKLSLSVAACTPFRH